MSEAAQLTRAVALVQVKGVQESAKARKFRGVATTPELDRQGDRVDPMTARFRNPLVLLHQHKHDAPIGQAVFDAPTPRGIAFTAEIPIIDEPGLLKDRTDLAWHEIKAGLVRAVSIGFIPDHGATERNAAGGLDFRNSEIIELSTVSVPANAGATIQEVKAIDAEARAAANRLPIASRGRLLQAQVIDDHFAASFRRALDGTYEEFRTLMASGGDARPIVYTQEAHDAFKMLIAGVKVRLDLLDLSAGQRLSALEAQIAALGAGEPRS